MVLVNLHETLYRGEALKGGRAGTHWRAANWGIGPSNVARIVPDNWRTHE